MSASDSEDQKKQNFKTSDDMTVKEWLLCSELSPSSCSKLLCGGYDTMALFDACTQDDIDDIVKEFNLSNDEHIKLRAAVNALLEKQTNALKVIDSAESDAMNKIQKKIDSFIDSMNNISTTNTQIIEQHKQCEKQINEIFKKIEHRIKKRKDALLQKLSKMIQIKQTQWHGNINKLISKNKQLLRYSHA